MNFLEKQSKKNEYTEEERKYIFEKIYNLSYFEEFQVSKFSIRRIPGGYLYTNLSNGNNIPLYTLLSVVPFVFVILHFFPSLKDLSVIISISLSLLVFLFVLSKIIHVQSVTFVPYVSTSDSLISELITGKKL